VERRNIAAFTETNADATNISYPAYLSINREGNGTITVTVRERGNGGLKSVTITIPEFDLHRIAGDIIANVENNDL
jgi:hypothetical protein